MMPVREGRVYSFSRLDRETFKGFPGCWPIRFPTLTDVLYSTDGWPSTHQMSINGKFDNIARRDLLDFADKNNIKDASATIDNICEQASRWPEMAKECGVPSFMINAVVPNMLINL